MPAEMTSRERLLAAMRGEPLDRIPFAPQAGFFLSTGKRNGSLPPEWRDMDDPSDIILDMGGDPVFRVEGKYQPVSVRRPNVRTTRWVDGKEVPAEALATVRESGTSGGTDIRIEHETPRGVLTEEYRDSHHANTVFRTKHLFTEPQDFPAVKAYLEDMTFTPNFDAFEARVERVRDGVPPPSFGPMNTPVNAWAEVRDT